LGRLSVEKEVLPGDDEPLLVALYLLRQPARAWLSADEDEKGRCRGGLCAPGDGVFENEALETSLPSAADDPGPLPDLYVLRCLDLLYKVARA